MHLGYSNRHSYSRHSRKTHTSGQTRQGSQPGRSSAELLNAFDPNAQLPSPPPQSEARRAAEAAFAAPAAALPTATAGNLQARITVKRARLAILAKSVVAEAASADAHVTQSLASPQTKAPRVFRVDGGPAKPSADAAGFDAPPPTPTKRARRRATPAHQAAGPVLHVVHSLPAAQSLAPVATPTLADIRAQMAQLTQLIEAIQQARALTFVDEQFDKQWRKLLLQAQSVI